MARILLIEGEPHVRKLMKEILEEEGHEIIECDNGTDGVREYKRAAIDLVVLDVLLPDKDGLDTLRELKQHHDDVKVMAISGGFVQGAIDMLPLAKRLGARHTLDKPFDLKMFLSAVKQLLDDSQPSP